MSTMLHVLMMWPKSKVMKDTRLSVHWWGSFDTTEAAGRLCLGESDRMSRRAQLVAFVLAALCAFGALIPPAGADGHAVITSDGVAGAIVGSTVEELADQLGDDYEISDEVRITVDFTGHVVSRDGTVQFRAVKANAPGDELSLFIVNNPEFRTAEGVGPGSSIAEGEQIYGNATLTRNPENESREFVEFQDQTDSRVAFRTPGIAGTYVGEYDGEATETADYDEDGVIAAVWISCRPGRDCPDDDGAATGGGDTEDADDADDDADADDGDGEAADDDAGAEGDGDGADGAAANTDADDNDLPETGTEQVVMVTVASAMLLLGGFFVLVNRNFLAPGWLGSRSW